MENNNYTKGVLFEDLSSIIRADNGEEKNYYKKAICQVYGQSDENTQESEREVRAANIERIIKCWNEYDKLKEENALLIEALDELYRWAESVQGHEVSRFITKTPDSIFTMAKKLLDNLKK